MSQCISPVVLNRGAQIVPCGKCNFCLSNRRQDWSFRLSIEEQHCTSAYFITLTYDADHVPIKVDTTGAAYYAIEKKHLSSFHKHVQQWQRRYLTKKARTSRYNREDRAKLIRRWKIRYFSVSEYGTNFDRPHYHSIMFNLCQDTIDAIASGKIWGRGYVKFGGVTPRSINYVTKYALDHEPAQTSGRVRPSSMMSKRPGLGYQYLEHNTKFHKPKAGQRDDYRFYLKDGNYKKRLPRYYKDRIFTTTEKQIASIEAQMQAFAREQEQLLQLATMHYQDPAAELAYRQTVAHAKIRTKSKLLNTF